MQKKKSPILIAILFTTLILAISCANKGISIKKDFYFTYGTKKGYTFFTDSIGLTKTTSTPEDTFKARITALGFQFIRAVSENMYVVIPLNKNIFNDNSFFNSIDQLINSNKDILSNGGALAYPDSSSYPYFFNDQLILEFKENVSIIKKNEFFTKNQLTIIRQNPYWQLQYVVTLKDKSLRNLFKNVRKLADNEDILFIKPNFILPVFKRTYTPGGEYYKLQWSFSNDGAWGGSPDADADVDKAWMFSIGNTNTKIAVIDAGFEINHPDLLPNWQYNNAERNGTSNVDDDRNNKKDDSLGWNFTGCKIILPTDEDCGSPEIDPDKHGTAVAGIIAAEGNSIHGITGVCPECKMLPLEMGIGLEYDLGEMIDYARIMDVKIITSSVSFDTTETIGGAIRRAYSHGITIFWCADDAPINKCKDIAGSLADMTSLNEIISVGRSNNMDIYDKSGCGECIDLLAPSWDINGSGTAGIITADLVGDAGYNNTSLPVPDNPDCGLPDPITNDYTKCFNGTSAATPLAAGIAGLILSVAQNLTPIQVRYLLQDCADRIDPDNGNYSSLNGYSLNASGNPTHGFGRINAFEAIKIAAPLDKGGRNGVDIFLRDNYLDWGNTEQPSNYLFNSPRDFIPHWKSPDIKIDALADATGANEPTTSEKFEDFITENPVANKLNKVYIRVRNRGYNTAENVTIKLYWVYGGLALPAVWSGFPNDITSDPNWKSLGSMTIHHVPYSGSSVALRKDAAGVSIDNAQIVSFDFTPPDPSLNPVNHYCLMATIGCDADPLVSNGSTNLDLVTPYFNNISHKNFQIDPGSTATASGALYLYNPYNNEVKTKVILIDPANVVDKINPVFIDCTFILRPKQKMIITYNLKKAKLSSPTELTFIQEMIVDEKKKKKSKGGYTIYFRQ